MLLTHMDCGMYKITYGVEEDTDKELHRAKMRELSAVLESRYPAMAFKGHIITLQGVITPVGFDTCVHLIQRLSSSRVYGWPEGTIQEHVLSWPGAPK